MMQSSYYPECLLKLKSRLINNGWNFWQQQ
jgi:hypothetical protein